MSDIKLTPALAFLVAVNLLPLIGVFFFGWDAATIILLYWVENLVVGIYTTIKLAMAPPEQPGKHWGKPFKIAFFWLHFGGFCAAHGMILATMFNIGFNEIQAFPDDPWPGPLVFMQMLHNVVTGVWGAMSGELKLIVLGLLISHGISFFENHIGRGEYKVLPAKELFAQPYHRIVVMHIATIASGILIAKFGSPVALLILLVLLKTGIDIYMHNKEHKKRERMLAEQTTAEL